MSNRRWRNGSGAAAAVRVTPRRGPDVRLILGLVLVAASVFAGHTFVSSAGARVEVWTLARPVTAGAPVLADDIVLSRVGLEPEQLSAYSADPAQPPSGRWAIDLPAGSLVPRAATGPSGLPVRHVSLPVESTRLPAGLASGMRVDIWLTEGDPAAPGETRLVIRGALIADVTDAEASMGDQRTVVMEVSPPQAATLVSASRRGVVDLVGIGGAA